MSEVTTVVRERVHEINERYAPEQPLPAFAALITGYAGVLAGMTWWASRRGRLDQVGPGDLALYAVATHKLARIIAKAPVTSPLRAPFTEMEGATGPAELHEHVTGHGWRRAAGELLTCPFCLGQWIGTGFVFGGILAPRTTRAVAATFAVHAGADALQFAYAALERTDR